MGCLDCLKSFGGCASCRKAWRAMSDEELLRELGRRVELAVLSFPADDLGKPVDE